MAREVTHTEHGPLYLDEDDIHPEKGDIAICRCGLSDDRPFCDGSHNATTDEAEDVVYKYEDDDPEAPRREVVDFVFGDEGEG